MEAMAGVVELGSPAGLGWLWFQMRQCEVSKAFMPLGPSSAYDLDNRIAGASTSFEPCDAREKLFGVRSGEQWLGLVGCRDVSPAMRYAEIHYMVDAAHRGKGYATAAVGILASRLFLGGFRRLGILIDARNLPSIAVARRNGFLYEGRLREHYLIQGEPRDQLLFGRLMADSSATAGS